VALRLEVDGADPRPPRRRRLRVLAVAAALFLGGLALGFWMGLAAAPEPAHGPGIHARSVSFFGTSSTHIVVNDPPAEAHPKAKAVP
jgi:hypothetical protein